MKEKEKGRMWKLTGPFASDNYTTLWDTIYYPKGLPPSEVIVRHEEIHSRQQHEWGRLALPLWVFCYLFVLPVLWNPFRKKWEMEAYIKGSGIDEQMAREILSGKAYGWLR